MRLINKIIVHCTDSNHPDHGLEEVRSWHKARQFDDIGYNYFITKMRIEVGRTVHRVPASVRGHNTGSIAIALMGKDNFTHYQFMLLKMLIKILQDTYNLTDADVYNHYDFNKRKTCPNFNVREILKR